MPRWPKGIEFKLDSYLSKHATLVDDRMSISGDSYTWHKVNTNLKRVKYIAIHHSVTPRNWTPEKISQLHLRRWGNGAGIGYHFVITEDGIIHYVGDLGTQRANVLNRNHEVIGVLVMGDFQNGRKPSDSQYRGAHVLCKQLERDSRFNLSWASVKFHNELQATACPCDIDKNKIIYRVLEKPKPKAKPVPKPKPIKVIPIKVKPIEKDYGKTIPTPMHDEEVTEEKLNIDIIQFLNSLYKKIKKYLEGIFTTK